MSSFKAVTGSLKSKVFSLASKADPLLDVDAYLSIIETKRICFRFLFGDDGFPGVVANSATPANPGEATREATLAAAIARARESTAAPVVRREGVRARLVTR